MNKQTQHRLTWRMYCPVYVMAESRQEAIDKAIQSKPNHIPANAELYYGLVCGTPAYVSPPCADNPS